MGSIDAKHNTSKGKTQKPASRLSAMATMQDPFARSGPSSTHEGAFDTAALENLKDPLHYKDIQGLEESNRTLQTTGTKIGNMGLQFGANAVSSFGQALANTFDLVGMAKTAKAEFTGANDDFVSHLGGLSTREMQDWAETVAKNNPIYERNEGAFDLTDPGWWAKQGASAGTGLGMAAETALVTAGIEFATGGLGTAGAMAKLGSMVSKLRKGARGAEVLADGFRAARGMRSAATMYATLSRTSESRMEAMNNYNEIYKDLMAQKNKDNSPKYSNEEAQHLASEGARRDFNINMALLPLDILSYRTMVFNPISGTGTGLVEKGLEKVAGVFGKSKVGKAAGWFSSKAIGAQLEGIEEGFQSIGENEGKHYAQVLGGTDDGTTFFERAGKDVQTDEFWNNYAGGIIGSPIIAGAMNLTESGARKRYAAQVAEDHLDYIKNVGKMNAKTSEDIKKLEAAGDTESASRLRRKFSSMKFLDGLHMDALADKDTAFDARMAVVDGVLEELNEGKTTALQDLGFGNLTPENLATIKEEFQNYKEDGQVMKDIYDNVKTKYNRNFVPEIAFSHFHLNRLQKEMGEVDSKLATAATKVPELGMLSSQGKQLHDTEYQIASLQYEKTRLQEEFKTAQNKFEKENINQLLTQNNEKLTAAADKVKGINADDTYDKAAREKDADIIQAALLNKEYQQAIYDKEALENTISLARKNVALYNNTEYMQGRADNSISKLRTKSQVDSAKANASKKTAQAVAKQEAVVNAANVAQNAVPANQGQKTEADQEDDDAMSTIASAMTQQQGNTTAPIVVNTQTSAPSADLEDTGVTLASFAPAQIDFDKTSDEAKAQITEAVKGIQDRLGPNSSFEDLVRHVIRIKGTTAADEMYQAIKYGWETNGNPDVDYDRVYQSIFGEPTDKLAAAFSQAVFKNPEEVAVANDKIQENIIAQAENKPDFDSSNQPIYKYGGRVTNEALPKGAYVTRLSKEVKTVNEDGTTTIDYEYTDDALNEASDVDSLQVLDPDDFNKGVQSIIRIPKNYMNIKIRTYKPDGSKGDVMTFGQYVALKHLSPTDQAYKDAIPMIHYKKDAPADAKGFMFVHDVSWYHPDRFNIAFPEDMKQAIESTRAIREEVLADDARGEGTPATITGKRQTTFKGLKTGGELISLRQANPDIKLGVVLDDGLIHTSKTLVAFPNNNTKLVNTQELQHNMIMDIRRYGLKDGIKTYLASYVTRPKLSQAARVSVVQAVNIYAHSLNPAVSPAMRQQHDEAARQIQETMGLNIKDPAQLQKYLEHFINVFESGEKLENKGNLGPIVARQAASKLKHGTPYITFESGSIYFGVAGIPAEQYVDKNRRAELINNGKTEAEADAGALVTTWNYFINPKAHTNLTKGLTNFNGKAQVRGADGTTTLMKRMEWYEHNLNFEAYNTEKDVPVVTIKADMTTEQVAPSYHDFLLDNLQTNLRSYNIGTAENPNWVTNIQPIITYDTNRRLAKATANPTMEEVADEVLTTKKETTESATVQQLLAPFENSPVFMGMTTNNQKLRYLAEQALNIVDGKPVVGGTDNYLGMVEKYGDKLITAAIDMYHKGELAEVTSKPPVEAVTTTTEVPGEAPAQPSTITPEAQALIDEMQKKLGDDFGVDDDGAWATPSANTQAQRNAVTKSLIRIGGLHPDQQSQVVTFIYNQILLKVPKGSGAVPLDEITATINEAMNKVFDPLAAEYKADIARVADVLQQVGGTNAGLENSIKGLRMRLGKIESIRANLPKLQELALIRMEKNTSIKNKTDKQRDLDSERQDDGTREGASDAEDEASAEEGRDFSTNILQENPEDRATYELRRFFEQIRLTDEAGQPINGFLNLPRFVGQSEVLKELMTTLSDTPGDFDMMMAKLKSRGSAIPWMNEVIKRLEGADQQMRHVFTTVMTTSPLRMKFTMIKFNRYNNTWSTKVYNTNQNAVEAGIRSMWTSNLFDTNHDLIIAEEGGYTLNKAKAQHLVNIYYGWKGSTVGTTTKTAELKDMARDQVREGKNVPFTPSDELAEELATKIIQEGDAVGFSVVNKNFQITKTPEGGYVMGLLQKNKPTREDLERWLGEFGIELSPLAMDELMKEGLFHNYKQRSYPTLFEGGKGRPNTNGLFGILSNHLEALLDKTEYDFGDNGDSPLDNTVVGSLATLEAKYNTSFTPFGFRDNGKSFFGLTAPKFVTDRIRDLKSDDPELREQLKQISFSQPSLWLLLMQNEEFRTKFGVATIGETAIKEQGSKRKVDSSLPKLADADHEMTKIGMFQDTLQGSVSYTGQGPRGEITLSTFPGTNIKLRMGTVFSLTYSDKQINTPITTAVLNFTADDLMNGKDISDTVANVIYDQTIKPELMRMIKFAQNGSKTDAKNYDKGAEMFLLMPEMNNIEISPGVKLVDVIKDRSKKFDLQQVEANKDLMKNIKLMVKNYVHTLTTEKLNVWEANGYVTRVTPESKAKKAAETLTGQGTVDINYMVDVREVGAIDELKYFDNLYLSKFAANTNEEKLQMAAMDYVINGMIANANSFMTLAGDPAMYYKEEERKGEDGEVRPNTMLERVEDTFTNAGKRLANQIAPGTTLANSKGDKYVQIFLKDRLSTAGNIGYLNELYGEENAEAYTQIEGSDAQEYTTWKEWLDILTKLGRTPDGLTDVTSEEIQDAREIFASNKTKDQLTERERAIINKVAQPLKPVYTGQIYDPAQDMMRTVYIKTSSFPLIPQLTSGLEIDKLRLKMEEMQKKSEMNVRASYQSGNKVGAMKSAVSVWDADGNFIENKNEDYEAASLVLDRKNFRIQQEVPFKSGKEGEDRITLGTQLMKLLFGDGIMNLDGFTYNGKPYTGRELHKIYNDLFINLINEKKKQLFTELGLDDQARPIDQAKSMEKLQQMLHDEAVKRDYPLQDIQGLDLIAVTDAVGKTIGHQFNLPLWASSNSNRYESMLNSIVTNRLIKMKFPGNSFVVGSPEGFVKKRDTVEGINQSKIIYTKAWNGKQLVGTTNADGTIKKAQVFVASKFKDNDGNLVDLFTMENGEYKYIKETVNGYALNEDMFDEELLSMMTFRIPTSGHQSASEIEIAGFLPAVNGDLMIVPNNFTKQKGLDFDVDKENGYSFNQYMNDKGKFEILKEKHKATLLAKAEMLQQDEKFQKLKQQYRNEEGPVAKKMLLAQINAQVATNKMLAKIMGTIDDEDIAYDKDEIEGNKMLAKISSNFDEKIMQNEIIRIHHSIYNNPNPAMQSKIAKTLNTDFAKTQADLIGGLDNGAKDKTYWTPLSDEYQKQKMMSGMVGKIGTGAYSVDVVFHSLAQQAAINGRPITLQEYYTEEENMLGEASAKAKARGISWRFGSYRTNGILGNAETIGKGRSIADVLAERQNVMVDNEKLQIAGVVGLNEITLDVDKIFNLLGFDKGEDGNSIAMLFLSQPIIKEYVARIRNASSNMATYDANKEANVTEALKKKFNPDGTELNQEDAGAQMNNANFIAALQNPTAANGQLQAAILDRFLLMKKYGTALRTIQSAINTDSKGLGKSFFDVMEKKDALNRIGSPTTFKDTEDNIIGGITGATGLVGDYKTKNKMTDEERSDLLSQGYMDIGQFLVKPDTLNGAFSIQGVTTAYNVWSQHFPYDAPVVKLAMDEIMSIVGGENVGATRSVELKQDIFRAIRKYLPTDREAGFIDIRDNVNDERKSLYIDSDENTSLSMYIKTLRQEHMNNPVVKEFIMTNPLLNRLEYHTNKNGLPSIITFKNAAGEDFDEQYLYESLSTLGEVRGPTGSMELPKVGNKQYTLDTLAQALIEYSYIGNATQEAIQFTKYTSLAYLDQIGYSDRLRKAGRNLGDSGYGGDPRVLGLKTDKGEDEQHMVGEITMQYVQHNPDKVRYSLDESDLIDINGGKKKSVRVDQLESFSLASKAQPTFIKAYNPFVRKGEKKYNLYWFDGTKYVKVPVLGVFGMDEYQKSVDKGIGKSIVNDQPKVTPTPQPSVLATTTTTQPVSLDALNINSGDIGEIVANIAKANISGLSELATVLQPFAHDIKIQYADEVHITTPRGVEVWNNFQGLFDRDNKVIYVSPQNVHTGDVAATGRIVLHEFVHALTLNQIGPYITLLADGDVMVKANAPAYVSDLVRLYNSVRELSNKEELSGILAKVRASKSLTEEQRTVKYGLTDIYEFMSMAMTQPEFQQYMAKSEFKQSGKTLLDQFKDIINNILKAIGVEFGSDTATASAINSIFDLIEQENTPKEDQDRTDKWLTDMSQEDREQLDDFEPGQMSAYPNIDLHLDENCY